MYSGFPLGFPPGVQAMCFLRFPFIRLVGWLVCTLVGVGICAGSHLRFVATCPSVLRVPDVVVA